MRFSTFLRRGVIEHLNGFGCLSHPSQQGRKNLVHTKTLPENTSVEFQGREDRLTVVVGDGRDVEACHDRSEREEQGLVCEVHAGATPARQSCRYQNLRGLETDHDHTVSQTQTRS